MIPSLSLRRSGRLFGKYLLVVVPFFVLVTGLCLSFIAERKADDTLSLLTTRIGSNVASMASALDYHHHSGNQRAAQDLINILMTDPAIECAELSSEDGGASMLKAPQGLGCRGMDSYQQLRLVVDAEHGTYLSLRYNISEVAAARAAQREWSLLAMVIGLLIAFLTSFVGFRYIIHKPLDLLLTAIEASKTEFHRVERSKIPNDELGSVMTAFNEMQTQLQEAHDTLEAKVEERTRELVELQSQLVKQERLSTLGRVTATMSHEIRNPLGAIRNSLFMIRKLTDAAGLKLTRPLDRAERSVARCDNIVGEMLEYTRTQDVELTTVDSCAFIDDVLDDQVLPDTITLTRDLPDTAPLILIDQDRFRRVLINLVDNAAQALRDCTRNEREIRVACRSTGDGTIIEVTDNGPGMPDDVLEKIFEPLFTTKSFGAGLGLPTVAQLVEQHNGQLHVETEVDIGTTFRIELPCAEAPTEVLETDVQDQAA